ncbi:MAG: DUF5676 family membrane protein [Nanoarchaeota archaeon]
MEKLSAKRVSFSLGIVTAIVSIVCALLIAITPTGTLSLFGSVFHGIDMSKIQTTMTFASAIQGTIVAIVLALVIGWLFAVVYNKVKK